jgi:hypothetical protein
VYDWLGFDVVDDRVFGDLVMARVVAPTSKADSRWVVADLGQQWCRTRRFSVTSR